MAADEYGNNRTTGLKDNLGKTSLYERVANKVQDIDAADDDVNQYPSVAASLAKFESKNTLRIEDYNPVGDGVADDYTALQAMLDDLEDHLIADFGTGEYYTSTKLTVPSTLTVANIIGSFATLKSDTSSILEIGNYSPGLAQYTGLSIVVTAYQPYITIPIGVTLAAGDYFRLSTDLSTPDTGYPVTGGYWRGFLASVVKVVGTTAFLDVASEISFTGSYLRLFQPFKFVSVSGLIFDNTGVTDDELEVMSLRVTGAAKCVIEDNFFFGSENCYTGISGSCNNFTIERNYIENYLNIGGFKGPVAPGVNSRIGYGIAVEGNNIDILTNIIKDCKHNIALGGRSAISQNIKVDNNTLSQDAARGAEYVAYTNGSGVVSWLFAPIFDAHANVGSLVVNGNKIYGTCGDATYAYNGSVWNIRSPRVTITNNTIAKVGGNGPAIFQSFEAPPEYIYIAGNTIVSDTAVALFKDATADSVTRLSASNKMTNVTTTIPFVDDRFGTIPTIIDVNSNPLADGNASIVMTGEKNVERFEIRSFEGTSMGPQPTFQGMAANGTTAVPTAVTNFTNLFTLLGFGWNGTAYGGNDPAFNSAAALIGMYASETHSETAKGSNILLATTENGTTTRTTRVKIFDDGHVYFYKQIETAVGIKFPDATVQTTASDPQFNIGRSRNANIAAGDILLTGDDTLITVYGTPGANSVVLTITGGAASPDYKNNQAIIIRNDSASAIPLLLTAGAGINDSSSTVSIKPGTYYGITQLELTGLWYTFEVSTHIVNDLTTGGTGSALSAQMGYTLNLRLPTAAAAGYIPFAADTVNYTTESALFWDAANNRLGVGTAAPTHGIHVAGSGVAGRIKAVDTGSAYGSGSGSSVALYADNGTAISATGTLLGAVICGGAYNTSAGLNNSVGIEAYSEGAFTSSTVMPSYLIFRVAGATGSRLERLRIASSGLFTAPNGGGFPFGMQYTNTSFTVTVAVMDTWYEADVAGTTMTAGALKNVTQSDHYMVAVTAGYYEITITAAVKSSAAADEIAIATAVNGTASETSHGHATVPNPASATSITCITILSLAANDQVSVAVKNHSAARDVTIPHLQQTMKYIGS